MVVYTYSGTCCQASPTGAPHESSRSLRIVVCRVARRSSCLMILQPQNLNKKQSFDYNMGDSSWRDLGFDIGLSSNDEASKCDKGLWRNQKRKSQGRQLCWHNKRPRRSGGDSSVLKAQRKTKWISGWFNNYNLLKIDGFPKLSAS
jgi:hypothetical protein